MYHRTKIPRIPALFASGVSCRHLGMLFRLQDYRAEAELKSKGSGIIQVGVQILALSREL